ncbi:GAF domain-containing protein [Halobaculum sp. EA56]|uniref:GAF domain-containing protein n=1 Tax=Halobaculum sp. EA56 TaxID=3421648 RepID=UPI003EB84257
MSSPHDARVLVAVSDNSSASVGADIAEDIETRLGVTTLRKSGSVAAEYLRELGPTIDCVVCVAQDPDCVETLSVAAGEVPVIVYGDEIPPVPVDDVIATDGGTGVLARRVEKRIDRARERDALAEANAKLAALNTYTRELTGCETVDEVSDTVVDAVTQALGHGQCALAILEGDEFYAYGHTLPSDAEVRLGADEGVAGRTYRTGETQIVDDYGADPDQARDVEYINSVVSVPVGDRGVLQVTSDLEGAFDERDAEFLEIVGSHAGEALARLEREADLRLERDRLHAFFDGICSPAVYVEETASGSEATLREVNPAYERFFGEAPVGEPVPEAFPTDVERRLFGERIRSKEVVSRTIEREADRGPKTFTVGMVPVQSAGPAGSAFGLYAVETDD